MAIAESPRSVAADSDRRFVLSGIRWEFYEAFLEELNNRHVFLTYDRGSLELMSPSFRHEI